MKTLNLIKPGQSEVSFRIDRFPDGEVQFVLTEELNRKDTYTVDCRITNAEELFLLLQVGDVLDRQAVVWDLHIRYLMGMRMDRVMGFERPFTLKIVCKLISQLGYDECEVFAPHSGRTELELRACNVVEDFHPYRFVANVVKDENTDVVFPDRGACDRYSEGFDHVYFEKERDIVTGRIEWFALKNEVAVGIGTHFLFYDDLCDAGGTFLGELKILKEKYPNAKFDIRVAHIVNEVGLDNLCQNFDTVYTTESYRDWGEVAKAKGYKNLIIK